MTQSPTLNDVVDDAIDTRLDNFWTAIPAGVVSFDSASRRASIRILLANAVEDGAGEKRWYHPMVYNVPVVFPWGTGSDGTGYGITFPFGEGDTGLYVVSSLPTHQWQSRGNSTVELDEDRGSRNNVAHGFLIPTIHASKDVPAPVEQNAVVLHGNKVKVGGATLTQPTIMGTTYRGAEDTMLTAVSAAIALIASIPGLTVPQIALVTAATAAITAFKLPATAATYITNNTEVK